MAKLYASSHQRDVRSEWLYRVWSLKMCPGYLALVGMFFVVGTAFAGDLRVVYSKLQIVDYHDQDDIRPPLVGALESIVGHELESAPAEGERPHRLLVRVSFSTNVDLVDLAYKRKATVDAWSFFCGTRNHNTSLGSLEVYHLGKPLYQDYPAGEPPSPRSREYYFYFNVARSASPKSIPPESAYDLEQSPQDVCFYLTAAGSWWFDIKSNIATIPRDDLVRAFREDR